MSNNSQSNLSDPSMLNDDLLDCANQKIQRLSKRELQIMHYIVSGLQNKVIAHQLGISPRTVENHRIHICEKTGCKSQSELTCLFLLCVKKCLTNCSITKKCNHEHVNCPIEFNLLQS